MTRILSAAYFWSSGFFVALALCSPTGRAIGLAITALVVLVAGILTQNRILR